MVVNEISTLMENVKEDSWQFFQIKKTFP